MLAGGTVHLSPKKFPRTWRNNAINIQVGMKILLKESILNCESAKAYSSDDLLKIRGDSFGNKSVYIIFTYNYVNTNLKIFTSILYSEFLRILMWNIFRKNVVTP